MDQIPIWLGAIATLFTLAAVLGAAVAVYRTSVYSTSLRESDARVVRLRAEIGDYQRRETELEAEVALVKSAAQACGDRVKVLEDLVTHRKDDEEIKDMLRKVLTALGRGNGNA